MLEIKKCLSRSYAENRGILELKFGWNKGLLDLKFYAEKKGLFALKFC